MQAYGTPPRRRRGIGGWIFFFLLIGALSVMAMVLLMIAVFGFARVGSHQTRQLARMEMAQRELISQRDEIQRLKELELHTRRVPAKPMPVLPAVEVPSVKAYPQTIRVNNREITLDIDGQGKIKLDDKPVDAKRLRSTLAEVGKGREKGLQVTIHADAQCRFEHVAKVLAVCEELGIPNVQLAIGD